MKLFAVTFLLLMTGLSAFSGAPLRFMLMTLLAVGGVALAMDSFAYGHMDKRGITYRRYLKDQFVPWDKVAGYFWGPGYIAVFLKGGPLIRRRLDFSTATWEWDIVAQWLGRSTPEAVTWLEEQAKANPGFPQRKSGYSSWRYWFTSALSVTFFLLAVLVTVFLS